MNTVEIEELKTVEALKDLPDSLLAWLLEYAQYFEFEDGYVLAENGAPIENMWIIIEGEIAFYMDINGRQIYYYSFANNKRTGGIGGILPYSRMTKSPGFAYAVGNLRALALNKKHFKELEKQNFEFTQRLVSYMTDRARSFATLQLQHEKVSALGKLSAGIAHELNNPVSAINRISEELTKRLMLNFKHTEQLLFNNVNPQHIHQLRELLEERISAPAVTHKLSTIKRIELEDDLSDWLQNRKVSNPEQLSETFVEAGITPMELEQICNTVGETSSGVVLNWIENLISSQKTINDLEKAAERISSLVGTIKSHVHMDRTNDFQMTNIREDIENTLTLLGYKIREKNIDIVKIIDETLPDVEAFGGELNQVWMNLIDNAIYALQKGGILTIEVKVKNQDIKINIIDNGSGIPENAISKIFDPFFTTKKVGDGTGIGLDIVSRIMKRHQGDISVNSVPGRTEFKLCIPIKQKTIGI